MVRSAKKLKPDEKLQKELDPCFIGPPIPDAQAKEKWPERYISKSSTATLPVGDGGSVPPKEVAQARSHYSRARVDGIQYDLLDDVHVQGEEGKPHYIAKIVEMFESFDKELTFKAQWFYKAEDTMIKSHSYLVDSKRVFISEVMDDNPLDCLVSKLRIAKVALNLDAKAKEKAIKSCDFYYDMKYTVPHLTFSSVMPELPRTESETSTLSSESESNAGGEGSNQTKYLLDLYAGCGAMSTGLCLGASLSGIKLVTKWAVDINRHACNSLKINHPETEVRNEAAEDFLSLLKEWEKLCHTFSVIGNAKKLEGDDASDEEDAAADEISELSPDEFEVGKLLAVCYGDPNGVKKPGLHFMVRWKGFGESEDTWEPYEGLSNCPDKVKEFVTKGYRSTMLPLPGDVYFVCGGPPCQGVSGFNRFRNKLDPLKDEKNRQLLVYMEIIEYLKPKYVLMENVVDLLKFSEGFLGRYAVGRLVSMNYQTRLGMMAAGSYGVAQFRMRVFLWGAQPTQKLPPYPLPTHDVLRKGLVPTEFEEVAVGHDKDQPYKPDQLEKAVSLGDAISDLPPVTNNVNHEEREYDTVPKTEFQRYIRLKKTEIIGHEDANNNSCKRVLYDHQPLQLNEDDYERACKIPKKKGANFRDLPGVLVRNNRVEWDPSVERVKVKSGKPLVPDYAMTFVHGRSLKPFGRLWWDEIVNTVVTRAEPHNQCVLHPAQDRVLTIRENARLQGFPDYYKLSGPVKERYMQVGNAVAVPVALALGYTFGLACQGQTDNNKPLMTLPFRYPKCLANPSVIIPDEESE